MYAFTFLVSTLFTFTCTPALAAPVEGTPPARDRCGPKVQNPGDPVDTCHEQPNLLEAGLSPGAYSITPISGAPTIYNNVDCDPVIAQLCKTMSAPDVTLGRWYFHTDHTPRNNTFGDCQMGFYLPALKDAAPKPATVGEDGNNGNQCKNILGAIRWAARDSTGHRTDLKAETVNLVKPPVGVEGMWPLTEDDAERTDGKINFRLSRATFPLYIFTASFSLTHISPS